MSKNKQFDPEKTIFLIDGSSFLYRAYYGMRPLHTSKGEPVQAVYSFCRMIRKLISKFGAKYVALVWDSKGKTTRHDMFEQYKATRQAPPSDLFDQKARIVEIADKVHLLQVAKVGIEADDIIYSLAQDYKKKGFDIVVVTLDKDMGQMLDEHTYMYDAFKDIVIDVKQFEEKMGFAVVKLPFYFALLGDVSDNIPGVRGIGKKGALELVNQFSTLDDLYNHLDKVPRPRAREALKENKKNAFLSKELFLLQYEKMGVVKEDFLFNPHDWVEARSIFQELEFKTLLKEIDKDKQMGAQVVKSKLKKLEKYNFICVTSEAQLKELCYKLKNCSAFALDTETNGLRPLEADCIGVSFCVKEGESYYVPIAHAVSLELGSQPINAAESGAGKQTSLFADTQTRDESGQLSKALVMKYVKPILEDEKIGKYLHNAKFDMLVLHHMGIDMQGLAFDTLVAARLVSKEPRKNGLKHLSMKYFDEPMLTYDEVVTANKYKDFSQVPLELATLYAAADAHQTLKLTKVLKKELQQEKMQKLYDEIEFPLIEILYQMEKTGIFVDAAQLKTLSKKIEKELLTIEQKITSLVGIQYAGINLSSPKQVQELLFDHLKLPPQKLSTKKTGYSTDQEVLNKLAKIHPVPGLIVKYRELSKLKNTYIDALPTYINPHTGRIHTTFNQTDVATGRLSSYDPNLQNIPADSSEYGMLIRQAFEPKRGNIFISADYSQIELRVLAHLSGDTSFISAFLDERDIHVETASKLFGVPFEEVTHEQRQIGKRINFSILYGMTPYGLSRDLDIPLSEAKQYIDTYFEQYPKVSEWMESVIQETKKHGYVTTLWGRRRYIPGIYEKNKNLYELARRVAINTKAQGTAAEIMKKGMIELDHLFAKKKIEGQMLLQIHDELLISVSKKHKKEAAEIVQKALEGVVDWEVPLVITIRFGDSWREVSK